MYRRVAVYVDKILVAEGLVADLGRVKRRKFWAEKGFADELTEAVRALALMSPRGG
jgi:hypothetical protein